jgi:thioredoxin reductase
LYAKQRRIAIIGGSKSALDAAERLASVRLQ